jgi:uncharacterized membrane protein YfcA
MAGMFGIGGGIVIVPTLILCYHFTPAMASGTSLAALLMPVGILAVVQYYRSRLIQVRPALLIALGIVSGVAFGSMVAIRLDPMTLKTIYGIFLLAICNNFIRLQDLWRKHPQVLPVKEQPQAGADNWFMMVFLGLLAGVLAGFFGIGGGIIIVPILTLVFKYSYKTAVGTSLLALLFPVGLPGVIVYYQNNAINLMAAILIGIGLFSGAFLGAKITLKLPAETVRRLYGLFLVVVALDFIFNK